MVVVNLIFIVFVNLKKLHAKIALWASAFDANYYLQDFGAKTEIYYLCQWFLTWVRSNLGGSAEVKNYKTIFNNTIFDIHVLLVLFFEHIDFVCN